MALPLKAGWVVLFYVSRYIANGLVCAYTLRLGQQ